jgi:hypothetical protein
VAKGPREKRGPRAWTGDYTLTRYRRWNITTAPVRHEAEVYFGREEMMNSGDDTAYYLWHGPRTKSGIGSNDK